MTSTSSLSSKESTLSTLETLSPPIQKLKEKLEKFVIEKCQPAERIYEQHLQNRIGKQRWTIDAIPPCIEELKNEAKMLGLWNLFLPHPLPTFLIQNESCLEPSIYLSTREYGILCEVMGKSFLAPEACNCNAPDTGNMEVLLKHGSIEQQQTYLPSLLNGESRSAFLMTEPDVASSDATNIQTSLTKVITQENDHQGGGNPRIKYILNGRKWWSTGAMDPRCKMALVLARMDYSHPSVLQQQQQHKQKQHQNRKLNIATSNPNHGAHTVVIVPMEKVTMIRPLTVFGCDDAPHGHAEVLLDNIVLDESCLVLGEGRGFEIAQSRLGPGRIHHCMRAVGLAVRCYDLMLERSLSRKTFGKYLCEHGGCQEKIADSKADIEAARLLLLSCAAAIDTHGARKVRDQIALVKVVVPELAFKVIDRAIQVHGGAGVSSDFPLAKALTGMRTLRIADGPDEVHKRTIALMEIKKAKHRMNSFSKL